MSRRLAIRRTIALIREASTGRAIAIACLTTLSALAPPLLVLTARRLVDAAFVHRAHSSSVTRYAIALGVIASAQRVLSSVQQSRLETLARDVARVADRAFLKHASQVDVADYENPEWHDKMARAARELQYRPFVLVAGLMSTFGASVTVLGLSGVLLSLSPAVLVATLIAVVIPVPFQRDASRRIYQSHFGLTTEDRERGYLRFLLSEHSAARELRALGLGETLLERQQYLATKIDDEFAALRRRSERIAILAGVAAGVALAFGFVTIGNRAASGTLTAGDVTALIAAITALFAQVSALGSGLLAIDEHTRFLDDYFGFIDHRPTVGADVRRDVPDLRSSIIEFDDVSFTYPSGSAPALDGLSLQIRPGEVLALVGENGGGKSTLVNLLLRFYEPSAGRVRIGDVDLSSLEPSALWERLGVVFQAPTPYLMSVRDNVRFGSITREVSDERIWDALRAARAESFVRALPGQLDAIVGWMFEGGHDISGGQWKRLALARVIYRDADLWLLDEPSSDLDPSAEAELFRELRALLRGRTAIVVTHRFSTTRIADRIAVISDGRVAEIGTHEELMSLEGRYATNYREQVQQLQRD